MKRVIVLVLVAALVATFLVLAIPAPDPPVPPAPEGGMAFAWDRAAYWEELEDRFARARQADCSELAPVLSRELSALAAQLDEVATRRAGPDDPALDRIESEFFEVTAGIAACPELVPELVALASRVRATIKDLSVGWDLGGIPARSRLYRSLYGARGAVEEVLMHHPAAAPVLVRGRNEPSATPSAVIHGVRVHSGDMLVSRGGAPTSALIARGNDYPGNFSHVALVHVDAASGEPSIVEAHIERGVAVATPEAYLADTKLRVMLLRPRAELPALLADPMAPHEAAGAMLARARAGHVPYDFAMDYTDPARLFCSEVASWAYRDRGITLWTGLSTISSPGLRRWLAGFGVTHFETQEPSDLEYDPQLVVVAEWRDPDWLARDRVDNAVLDAMLAGSERGDDLSYPWYALPVARAAIAWSWVARLFGKVGPVPEGMSAAGALRNHFFSARQRALAARVQEAAGAWAGIHGYPPPYWELVRLADEAVAAE